MSNARNEIGYGFSSALPLLAPRPFVSIRAPLATDVGYPFGQLWINKLTSTPYIMASVTGGAANWQAVLAPTGVLAALTVTAGPTAITGQFTLTAGANAILFGADGADHALTAGSVTGVSTTTLQGGTGGIIASTAVTGVITLGLATMTGAITLGRSTAGQTINIGNGINVGAQVINMAAGASGANSTVNILSGNGTAGTQTLNVMSGTRAGVVNIGTGAAAHVVTVGNNTAGSSVVVNSPYLSLPGGARIYSAAGAPSAPIIAAALKGDLYINLTAVTTITRLYICDVAGVSFTTFTTAA